MKKQSVQQFTSRYLAPILVVAILMLGAWSTIKLSSDDITFREWYTKESLSAESAESSEGTEQVPVPGQVSLPVDDWEEQNERNGNEAAESPVDVPTVTAPEEKTVIHEQISAIALDMATMETTFPEGQIGSIVNEDAIRQSEANLTSTTAPATSETLPPSETTPTTTAPKETKKTEKTTKPAQTTEAPRETTQAPQTTAAPTTTAAPQTTTTAAPTTTPTTQAPTTTQAPSGSYNSDYAREVLNIVNNERAAQGLPALEWDSSLADAANIRSKEISISFSHTRPDGSAWNTAGAQTSRGENIAYGYGSPSSVMAGWMDSDGHRQNILRSSFTRIGVSCYSINGTLYWVQEFA